MAIPVLLRQEVVFLLLVFISVSVSAPVLSLPKILQRQAVTSSTPDEAATESPGSLLLAQWRNPKETLSVLLIIGGDIVQKAIAQMTGAMYLQIHRVPRKMTGARTKDNQVVVGPNGPQNTAPMPVIHANDVFHEGQDVRTMLMFGMPQLPSVRGINNTSSARHEADPKVDGTYALGSDQKQGTAATGDESNPKKPKKNMHFSFVPLMAPLENIGGQKDTQDWRLGITPVAFSFGWVGYAFASLMSVFGEGLLMPETDNDVQVVNLDSGTKKRNESWVLGRLVRDLSIIHAPEKKPGGSHPEPAVFFYRVLDGAGKSSLGRLWWASIMIPMQFIIASAPVWEHWRQPDALTGRPDERNWVILMITAIGTGLALLTGAIPQWHVERFPARKDTKQNFILTKGNGHVVSFVIMNPQDHRKAMHLEDLAIVRPEVLASPLTKLYAPVLALCWVFLLLCIGGLERDTWYLFGVGMAGMVQNIIIASWWKYPNTHGLPMELAGRIEDKEKHKLMTVLKHAEMVRPNTGIRLRRVFFKETTPTPDEKSFWERQEESLERRETKRKSQHNDLLNLAEEMDLDEKAAKAKKTK